MNSTYLYNITNSDLAILGGFGIFTIVIAVIALVAYFISISLLVKAADGKGYTEGHGKLWFVGIFLSPILLALIVIAMPDKARHFN